MFYIIYVHPDPVIQHIFIRKEISMTIPEMKERKIQLGYTNTQLSILFNDKGCVGTPDWILEIVSPGSRCMDYFIKLFKYRTSGVREYWIVDPDKNRILVYNFESEDTWDYSLTDSVPSGIYPDFSVDFGNLNI